MMLPKYQRVINLLRNGAYIKLPNSDSKMILGQATFTGIDTLSIVCHQEFDDGTTKEILLPFNIEFNEFVKMCEEISEEELVSASFSNALLNS